MELPSAEVPSVLSPTAATVLFICAHAWHRDRNGRVIAESALHDSDLAPDEFWFAIDDLEQRGFVNVGPNHLTMWVTTEGRTAALRFRPEPRGRVDEFATAMDAVAHACTDIATESVFAMTGGGVRMGAARAQLRAIQTQLDLAAATRAFEDLVPRYLTKLGGLEASFKPTLRGLFASKWGKNALSIAGAIMDVLGKHHREDPNGLVQYSWREVRTAAGLPHEAIGLLLEVATLANLGGGPHPHSGEVWFSAPLEVDRILEHKEAITYLRLLLDAEQHKLSTAQPAPERAMKKHTPERKYTVFISSTQQDLLAEREQVASEILTAGHIPCGMEQFAASGAPSWDVITRTIDICDYYVLIVGGRYGSIHAATGKSWTEREYEYAVEKGLPVLAFIRDAKHVVKADMDHAPERQRMLNDFIGRVESQWQRATWTTSDDLRRNVAVALMKHVREDENRGTARVGWYRGDTVVSAKSPTARCGNVYWLGNNIVYTALALTRGADSDAFREWNHAIHHAIHANVPDALVQRLRSLQDRKLDTSDDRRRVIDELQALWNEIGRDVQAHQPDFAERDVQRDQGP